MTAPNTTWQRVALDLARRIRSGETPVGEKIASHRELAERYAASIGTVKRAIEYLQDAGILHGVQGSGVFVTRVPDDDLNFDTAPDDVTGRVARLEESMTTIEGSQTEFQDGLAQLREFVGEISGDHAKLLKTVGQLEAYLIELYSRLGQPYPGSSTNQQSQRPRRRAAEG